MREWRRYFSRLDRGTVAASVSKVWRRNSSSLELHHHRWATYQEFPGVIFFPSRMRETTSELISMWIMSINWALRIWKVTVVSRMLIVFASYVLNQCVRKISNFKILIHFVIFFVKISKPFLTRNSSGDEIANVNFLCNDIVHALKYNRLLHKFRHRSFSATQVYQIQWNNAM